MGDRLSKMKAGLSQAPKVHIKKFFSQARKQVTAARRTQKKDASAASRLYVKGVVAGFKGSLAKQYNHTNLIKIQGVDDSKDVQFYLGKRICYIYRAKTPRRSRSSAPCGVRSAALTEPAELCVPSSTRTCHHPPSERPCASCSTLAATKLAARRAYQQSSSV